MSSTRLDTLIARPTTPTRATCTSASATGVLRDQILRSTDRGQTWSVFIRGWGDRAVDIAFDRKYVYFGQDNQDRDAIVRADKKTGATSIVLANSLGCLLLGPSARRRHVPHRRDARAAVAASTSASTRSTSTRAETVRSWTDVLQRPIHSDGAGYAYIDAYYQYPDGSVPLLISGYGTVVVRVGPPFPSNLASAHTPVSPAIGIARVASACGCRVGIGVRRAEGRTHDLALRDGLPDARDCGRRQEAQLRPRAGGVRKPRRPARASSPP